MDRSQVYKMIDDERFYQDNDRRKIEGETRTDDEKSVAEFILYIEHTLAKAKAAIYQLNEKQAMSYIRKVAGLAVAAMETHETPPRA